MNLFEVSNNLIISVIRRLSALAPIARVIDLKSVTKCHGIHL